MIINTTVCLAHLEDILCDHGSFLSGLTDQIRINLDVTDRCSCLRSICCRSLFLLGLLRLFFFIYCLEIINVLGNNILLFLCVLGASGNLFDILGLQKVCSVMISCFLNDLSFLCSCILDDGCPADLDALSCISCASGSFLCFFCKTLCLCCQFLEIRFLFLITGCLLCSFLSCFLSCFNCFLCFFLFRSFLISFFCCFHLSFRFSLSLCLSLFRFFCRFLNLSVRQFNIILFIITDLRKCCTVVSQSVHEACKILFFCNRLLICQINDLVTILSCDGSLLVKFDSIILHQRFGQADQISQVK